ncbi:MAG: M48 family metallopeptidase [Alphaproteobacteria bacterium]|nr:M48 family metallopeptidase [Alphaproteobacteria bacterium]
MGGAYGLQTHIWNNNWKTVLLMAGFPVLLLLLTYALFLLYAGLTGTYYGNQPTIGYFIWAGDALAKAWPFAIAGALLWFGIAYVFYQGIIDAATGAHKVERMAEPKLYNLLENLCISRGITMPALRIMETDALNAFATGLHKGNYSVTVTRGLMNTLNDDELEAVLAHELTHIRNADVRLLIIAVIFVGIFSFVGEMTFRSLRFGGMGGGSSRRSSGGSRDSGGGAAIAIIVALVIIGIAYALAIVIRFALSRRREYLADAGAVELTKNPDAMITALQKISGNPVVASAPSEVREMFIENPHSDFAGIFATHPPIAKRIEALARFAGGRVPMPQATPPASAQPPSPGKRGPWG